MKLLLSLLCCALMVLHIDAAGCPAKCPGCEGRRIGESWKVRNTGDCSDLTCKKTGELRYSWSSRGCPTYKLQAGCFLTPVNYNVPYPACCPVPRCSQPLKKCPEKCPNCENRYVGETWRGISTSGCFEITCKKDGPDRYSWSGKGCTTYQEIPSNCQLIYGNPNSQHPGCCDRLSCGRFH